MRIGAVPVLLRIVPVIFPVLAMVRRGYFIGRRVRVNLRHADELRAFVPARLFSAAISP